MAEKQKTPLIFYRTASGVEPVRAWLKSLPSGDRKAIGLDLDARAVALAGRHAIVPTLGSGIMGGADGPAEPPDRASFIVFRRWTVGCAARIYQEDAKNFG